MPGSASAPHRGDKTSTRAQYPGDLSCGSDAVNGIHEAQAGQDDVEGHILGRDGFGPPFAELYILETQFGCPSLCKRQHLGTDVNPGHPSGAINERRRSEGDRARPCSQVEDPLTRPERRTGYHPFDHGSEAPIYLPQVQLGYSVPNPDLPLKALGICAHFHDALPRSRRRHARRRSRSFGLPPRRHQPLDAPIRQEPHQGDGHIEGAGDGLMEKGRGDRDRVKEG